MSIRSTDKIYENSLSLQYTYLQCYGLAVNDVFVRADSRNETIHFTETVIRADFAILLRTKRFRNKCKDSVRRDPETPRNTCISRAHIHQHAYLPCGVQTLHAPKKHIFVKRHVCHDFCLLTRRYGAEIATGSFSSIFC